jgi:hypothetical protein
MAQVGPPTLRETIFQLIPYCSLSHLELSGRDASGAPAISRKPSYKFSDDLKRAYQGFNLDIPALNGTLGEWALPVSATYVIDRDGTIICAYTDVDYRDRADPNDVLQVLTKKAVAA